MLAHSRTGLRTSSSLSFSSDVPNSCFAQRFDQGPSLLLLPELFKETFADLGTTLEGEGVHLLRCDPNYEVHFDDGEKITLSSDLSVMKDEIERWEGKDGFDRYAIISNEQFRGLVR